MRKLSKYGAALVLAVGMVLAGSVSAQAWNYYTTQRYCPWLQKATIGAYTTAGIKFTIRAYSPSGYLLGSRSGYGNIQWSTPWEDVNFRLDGPNTIYYSSWCRA